MRFFGDLVGIGTVGLMECFFVGQVGYGTVGLMGIGTVGLRFFGGPVGFVAGLMGFLGCFIDHPMGCCCSY